MTFRNRFRNSVLKLTANTLLRCQKSTQIYWVHIRTKVKKKLKVIYNQLICLCLPPCKRERMYLTKKVLLGELILIYKAGEFDCLLQCANLRNYWCDLRNFTCVRQPIYRRRGRKSSRSDQQERSINKECYKRGKIITPRATYCPQETKQSCVGQLVIIKYEHV